MSFCKDFNVKMSEYKSDVLVLVEIVIYGDKSFEWRMKTSSASYFIVKVVGVVKFFMWLGYVFVGSINLKYVYEIVKVKVLDEMMGYVGLESATKSVLGTARAMGIRVVDLCVMNVN